MANSFLMSTDKNDKADRACDKPKAKLVFDLGLILEQSLTYYSGLICSVTVKQNSKSKKNPLLN